MTQSLVTAIVVTHNSHRVIGRCLDATSAYDVPVIVIDNASIDRTQEEVRWRGVPILCNRENIGFAAAVNQAVRAVNTPFLLLLNPDAILRTSLEALLEICSNPNVGAVGGQLVTENGVPQKGFNVRRFPTAAVLFLECLGVNRLWRTNPWNWRYRCLDLDLAHASNVDQPAGAFLLFRHDAWSAIGGFDEGFVPIWFEDVDFCRRLTLTGYSVSYTPHAIAAHEGAHSINILSSGERTRYWYRSLLRYSIRHFSKAGKILVCLGVIAGFPLRLLSAGIKTRHTGWLQAQLEVVSLAFRALWIRTVELNEVLK